jgi:hypothetical protein
LEVVYEVPRKNSKYDVYNSNNLEIMEIEQQKGSKKVKVQEKDEKLEEKLEIKLRKILSIEGKLGGLLLQDSTKEKNIRDIYAVELGKKDKRGMLLIAKVQLKVGKEGEKMFNTWTVADTGATASVINLELLEKLGLELKESETFVRMASGNLVDCVVETEIELRIGEMKFVHPEY